MDIIILMMAMYYQKPSYDNVFMYSQEQSIHSFSRDSFPPKQYEDDIVGMGDKSFAVREKHSYILKGNIRACVWGSYSKDPEIVNRSMRILHRKILCLHCEGSGICPAKPFDQCQLCHYIYQGTKNPLIDAVFRSHGCVNCLGTKSQLFKYSIGQVIVKESK